MNDSKGYTQDDINSIAGDGKGASEKYGTFADRRDMERMGKTQKLRRNFGFFSILGFSMILLSTWEIQLGYESNHSSQSIG